MTNSLGAKPVVDTSEFQNGIKRMNSDLRVLESGFRATAAGMTNWTKDATGLEARIKTLNSSIDIQKQKVEAVRAQWEKQKTATGENSLAAQGLEVKLNKETETLNKMSGELAETEGSLQEMKQGSNEAGDSVETLEKKSAAAEARMGAFKSVLGGVGTALKVVIGVAAACAAAVVALAVAIGGVIGMIGGLVFKASEGADAIAQLAGQTGMTTDKIQELAYIGSQLDVSVETTTGAFTKMTKSMGSAQDETEKYNDAVAKAIKSGKGVEDIKLGSAAQAYKDLGVSVVDANGKLRDNNVVFGEVVTALGKVQNPTERDVLAMQLLGKSAMELNPLFAAGADAMAQLGKEAHKNGAVALPESISALDKLSDSIAGLKLSAQGVGMNIAAMFAPFGQGLIDRAQGYMVQLNTIITSSGSDKGKMTTGITGLVAQIATDVANSAPQMFAAGLTIIKSISDAIQLALPSLLTAGTEILKALVGFIVTALPSMLTTGLTIVKSILDAIQSALPSMLTAGIEILKSLVTFIISALPSLLDAGVQILLFLIDAIVQSLPMLIDAGLQAIIALANGLSAALPTLIPAIVQAIITIVMALIENLPMLIQAAMTLILALAQGLIQALPILIAAIPQIVNALMGGLMAAMPIFFNIAGQLLGTLGAGVMANMFVIIATIGKLIAVIVENLAKLPGKALEAGKNFVQGLINGIKSGASALFATVSDLISKMLGTATGPEGIHAQSPSKKGRAIGANFGGSLGIGVMDTMRDVENAVIAVTGRMGLAAVGATGAGFGGGNSSVSNEHYSFFAPVTIGAGAGSLGETVKGKRF